MGDPDLAARLIRRAERAEVGLASATATRLAAYLTLLLQWNARMNLTSLDDRGPGLDRLVMEPLRAAPRIPSGAAVIDIGSGGGSPAIPLLIVRPDLTMRLVEAKARKAAFLREAIRRLMLEHAVVETARYQRLAADRPDLRAAHDVLTVRAVRVDAAGLRCLHTFVRPGGALLCFRDAASVDLPAAPDAAPLVREAIHPLVASRCSQLLVLRKPRAA